MLANVLGVPVAQRLLGVPVAPTSLVFSGAERWEK